VAERVGCSQSLIARVERGGADRLTVAMLDRICQVLGARFVARVDWNGEAADRLLDADHAALIEYVVRVLRDRGWEVIPEATFAIRYERGSIDVLAWHPATATVLIVEVKSVVPDIQATVATLDRKERLALEVARSRGWNARQVASLLVVGESRTARRRVELHASTFAARFPHRAAEIRQFLADPGAQEPVRGLWFVSVRTGAGSRQRVVRGRRAA
jgi:transcriptional regulator with XRE-family HTH domain